MTDTEELHRRAHAAITEAFGDLHHNGGQRLYDAELADNYGEESPLTRRLADLTYDHWTEIPDWALAEAHTALSHLEPEPFRFHLPAYMIWTLDNFDNPEVTSSLSPDMTIYATRHHPDRFATFDEPQRDAIRAFLRFAAAHDDHLDGVFAQNALVRYWDH